MGRVIEERDQMTGGVVRAGSQVDESSSAPPGAAAAAARRRIPGEEGIWVFVLVDMTVFAMFFATFMYARGHNHEAFVRGHGSLSVVLGTVNTVLLLTSSLVVAIAVQYVLSGRHRKVPMHLGAALACGLGFIAVKALEWTHLLMAGKPSVAHEYFAYYFVFTGVHLFHVGLGVCVLIGLIVLTRRPALSGRQLILCEAGGIFWHMVDLLWVVLFALFYLVR